MDQIIATIAKVPITDSMLDKVDMSSLMSEFEEDFDKLDDLKEFREEYDTKNAVMRWWDNNELRDAQLDAVQLQASFSKKLGQLMVVAMTQSKMLTQQQVDLKEQQEEIQSQTKDIASANKIIAEQQTELSEQQEQLKNLIDEYFQLKGLTAEGAKKLIEIAKEVEATKDTILESVEQSIVTINSQYIQLNKTVKNQETNLQLIESTIQVNLDDLANQHDRLKKSLGRQLQLIDKKFRTVDETQVNTSAEFQSVLSACQNATEKFNADLREEITGLSDRISKQQLEVQNRIDIQQKKFQTLAILSITGFGLAMCSVTAFVWQHKNIIGY